jgi:hypothetical protein
MVNSSSAALSTEIRSFQLKETVILLFASVALQFGIHFIRFSSVPAGAILLPMFIAPLIACIFFRLHTALIAGILAPTVNYLITGAPKPELLLSLTAELVLFTLLVHVLLNFKRIKMFAAVAGILSAKVFSSLLLPLFGTSGLGLVESITTAVPGILLLFLLNVLLLRYKENG